MGVHLSGDGKVGGGDPDNGGIHLEMLEHGHTVHHYVITVITVLGVGKVTRGAGGDAVVGAGRDLSGRGKGSVSGSGGKGWGIKVTDGA